MLFAFILILGVCAIAGALISQSKNREPWIGALLGLLLGVIGLVIVAVMPKLPPASS